MSLTRRDRMPAGSIAGTVRRGFAARRLSGAPRAGPGQPAQRRAMSPCSTRRRVSTSPGGCFIRVSLRLQQRQRAERRGRRQRLQERIHVGDILIGHHLRFVWRHLASRAANVSEERLERNRPRPQPGPLRASLPLFAMALIAADLSVQDFAIGRISSGRWGGRLHWRRGLRLCGSTSRHRRDCDSETAARNCLSVIIGPLNAPE